MKARERIDTIMETCRGRVEEEVSALLGRSLKLGSLQTDVGSRDQFFSQLSGKFVFAHMQLKGDVEGDGALLVSLKDAIRIGGSLIMLPDAELQEVMAEQNYTEELEDSYGEIANIICGAITSTFDEHYPKKFRAVRTEQEILFPDKLEPDAEHPLEAGQYYCCTATMEMEGVALDPLYLFFPGEPFGLVDAKEASSAEHAAQQQGRQASGVGAGSQENNASGTTVQDEERVAQSEPSTPSASKKGARKLQQQLDQLLQSCFVTIAEEISALIGGKLLLNNPHQRLCNKAEILAEIEAKQVVARMDLRGEAKGEAFLFTSLSSAVFLGGSLIMLPASELEETVANEELADDTQDAYGEIANIIAGAYSGVFEEKYRKKIGFVKTSTQTVVPEQVDGENDDVFPCQLYYQSAADIVFNDRELGRFRAIFPASVFDLEEELQQAPMQGEGNAGRRDDVGQQGEEGQGPLQRPGVGQTETADVLIVSDDEAASRGIIQTLEELGYTPRMVSFKSSINECMTPAIRLVFLVMKEINEQGFGVAIKISSSNTPARLVAAGPAWTRTLVIKAVKYGADDILITPATAEDIREKVEMNVAKMAA